MSSCLPLFDTLGQGWPYRRYGWYGTWYVVRIFRRGFFWAGAWYGFFGTDFFGPVRRHGFLARSVRGTDFWHGLSVPSWSVVLFWYGTDFQNELEIRTVPFYERVFCGTVRIFRYGFLKWSINPYRTILRYRNIYIVNGVRVVLSR